MNKVILILLEVKIKTIQLLFFESSCASAIYVNGSFLPSAGSVLSNVFFRDVALLRLRRPGKKSF